jgi:hypothetical protein
MHDTSRRADLGLTPAGLEQLCAWILNECAEDAARAPEPAPAVAAPKAIEKPADHKQLEEAYDRVTHELGHTRDLLIAMRKACVPLDGEETPAFAIRVMGLASSDIGELSDAPERETQKLRDLLGSCERSRNDWKARFESIDRQGEAVTRERDRLREQLDALKDLRGVSATEVALKERVAELEGELTRERLRSPEIITPKPCTHEGIGLPGCKICDPRTESQGGPQPDLPSRHDVRMIAEAWIGPYIRPASEESEQRHLLPMHTIIDFGLSLLKTYDPRNRQIKPGDVLQIERESGLPAFLLVENTDDYVRGQLYTAEPGRHRVLLTNILVRVGKAAP